MSRNTDGLADNLAADLAAVRTEVARLVDVMSEYTRDRAGSAGAHVADVLHDVRGRIASGADDARGRVRALNGDLVATVERHPMAALLVAFGVGISLGLMARRRD